MCPDVSNQLRMSGEVNTGGLAAPGIHRSCCSVLSCCECLEKDDRAFEGPHSAFDKRFDMALTGDVLGGGDLYLSETLMDGSRSEVYVTCEANPISRSLKKNY